MKNAIEAATNRTKGRRETAPPSASASIGYGTKESTARGCATRKATGTSTKAAGATMRKARAMRNIESERRTGYRRGAPEREDASHVIARLAIGGNASVLLDRVLSRVVRREDQVCVGLAESLGELGKVGGARPDVLPRVEDALHAESPSRRGHELHESARPLPGHGTRVPVRLRPNDRGDEARVDPVLSGRLENLRGKGRRRRGRERGC